MFKELFYKSRIEKIKKAKYICQCCGYKTLSEKDKHEICPVCFWEDDVLDDKSMSGANEVNIIDAKQNYITYGACSKEMKKYVLPKEIIVRYLRNKSN